MSFVFGEFELDPERCELRRQGQRVAVQPKILKLLLHLVMHRHRCVSNDELLAVIWPNEKVSAASITSAMRGVRRALGDAGTSQAIVRTVRGHGYQFAGEVAETATPPEREPRAPRLDAAFVGRAGVLEVLDEAIAQLCAGRASAMLLIGEAGIGKTRTLTELSERAQRAGARVWFARCLEGDGAPPFWPLAQLVREAAQDL
ncbi:MAG: winged helix-turn-helix domain-containing protein, partial [Polyangiales bacterium]